MRLFVWGVICIALGAAPSRGEDIPWSVTPAEVLQGLRDFYAKTARPDGSFQPGIDPEYRGMSDSAYSDLAPVTYACTVHKTFGWRLPHEERTVAFLLSRQRESGEFFNVEGTVDPASAEGKTYNTTQGLVALRALGVQPRHDPLSVFEEILRRDYQSLPPYSTSFFPLAYLCAGRPIPSKADEGIRALMVQGGDGYLNDHVAATFHASHYYHLVDEPTPRASDMVERMLREQKEDGSWLINPPARDRHATFDAVFTLLHEGPGREDCRRAIRRAALWALSCRNADGGFGHFPGSTSDADAVYFQIGTLVMAGFLKPAQPLPPDPHLLSWGHLIPVRSPNQRRRRLQHPLWVGAAAFASGRELVTGCADKVLRVWNVESGQVTRTLKGHEDAIAAVSVSPRGDLLASGSFDHTLRLWDLTQGKALHTCRGHAGPVLAVAIDPAGQLVASAGTDRIIRLWDAAQARPVGELSGHKTWVNALAFHPDGRTLVSASSDGTVRIWSIPERQLVQTLVASNAEVRILAFSPDGRWLAAGIRYGRVSVWNAQGWVQALSFQAHPADVWAVAFSADSRTLMTGNGDWNRPGIVALWDIPSGKELGKLRHTGEVLCLAVSPAGEYVAAGGWDKTVRIWAAAELAAAAAREKK
jgi:geranylgeranyl transferase type-2 subunit beta